MLRTLVWEADATGAGKGAGVGNGAPPRDAPGGIRVASPLPPPTDGTPWHPGKAGKAGKGADVALPPFCREVDDPTEISDLLEAPDHYLWLDLTSPSAEEL